MAEGGTKQAAAGSCRVKGFRPFTCCGPDWGLGGVHHIPVNGLGPWLPLLSPCRPRFHQHVHVLHEFELFPPQVLLLDELPPGFLLLLLQPILLCLQPGRNQVSQAL